MVLQPFPTRRSAELHRALRKWFAEGFSQSRGFARNVNFEGENSAEVCARTSFLETHLARKRGRTFNCRVDFRNAKRSGEKTFPEQNDRGKNRAPQQFRAD